MAAQTAILDQYGNPFHGPVASAPAVISRLRNEVRTLRAKYDAAADGEAFLNHWASSDVLSPDSASSASVRKKLRSRSRYEVIENNPFLKGTVLTIANDFVGAGARLKIIDDRVPQRARRIIERSYRRWVRLTKYRQMLWGLRLAKLVDGEGFKIAYNDADLRHPVKLNFMPVEADRISSSGVFNTSDPLDNEVDGVRFNKVGKATQYHLLDRHPGGFFPSVQGEWINANHVTHWFRKDRKWLRGIPETAASLPLCALLRRYTLAVVKAAETGADFAVVLESEAPPTAAVWDTQIGAASPFDVFPIEQGMFTTLPWGHKMSQMRAEQPIQTYDSFVKALLMEIMRPLLAPHNLAIGSSQDSNMASAIVDTHIYKGAQKLERIHCEEDVLSPDLEVWWFEYLRSEALINKEIANLRIAAPELLFEAPEHRFRWDNVGLDHTDPAKVEKAIDIAHKRGHLTDRQIQEEYYDTDLDDWRNEYEEQVKWRATVAPPDDGEGEGEEGEGEPGPDSSDDGEEV